MALIHKLSVVALVVLSLIITGMLVQHQLQAKHLAGKGGYEDIDLKKFYEEKLAKNAEIYGEVAELIKNKQYPMAMEKLEAIKTAHPENPQSFVYEAQAQYGQGQIASAIHSYRLAVDNDPDYVDKKTPLFISHEIMTLITEARSKLNREIKLKPNDNSIKMALEDVYYLQRRIAGGCE